MTAAFDPSAVRFVLVEPQSGGNVGAAARALKNLGFARLAIVAPGCDPRGEEARRMAVAAADVLENATVHDDLDAALEGASTVVGTTRRAGKQRRPHYRLDEVAPDLATLAARGGLAVVFGREAHGLSDAELDRCTHLVYFPADDSYPSFNLAQAVLVVAWELRLAGLDGSSEPVLEAPAPHEEREPMYAHLETALLAVGFLHQDSASSMMRRIRRLLGRAAMTSEEVRILRGIARQVMWAARRAGPASPREDPEP